MEGIFRDSVRVRAESALRTGHGAKKRNSRFNRCRGKMANALHTHVVLIILCVLVVIDASCVIGQILCDILIIQDKLKSSEQASDSLVSLLREKFPEHLNDTHSGASLRQLLELLHSSSEWNSTTSLNDVEQSWSVTLNDRLLNRNKTNGITPGVVTNIFSTTTFKPTTTMVLTTVGAFTTADPGLNIGGNSMLNDMAFANNPATDKTVYKPNWNSMRGKVPVNAGNSLNRVVDNQKRVNQQISKNTNPRFYVPPPKMRLSPPNVRGVPMPGPYLPRPMNGAIAGSQFPMYPPPFPHQKPISVPQSQLNNKKIPSVPSIPTKIGPVTPLRSNARRTNNPTLPSMSIAKNIGRSNLKVPVGKTTVPVPVVRVSKPRSRKISPKLSVAPTQAAATAVVTKSPVTTTKPTTVKTTTLTPAKPKPVAPLRRPKNRTVAATLPPDARPQITTVTVHIPTTAATTTSVYARPAPHDLAQSGRTKPLDVHKFRKIKNTELIHHGPPPTKITGPQNPGSHSANPNGGPIDKAPPPFPVDSGHPANQPGNFPAEATQGQPYHPEGAPPPIETGPHPPMPDPRYHGQPGLPPQPRHGPDMMPPVDPGMRHGPDPNLNRPMDPYDPRMGPPSEIMQPDLNQPHMDHGMPMNGPHTRMPDPRYGPSGRDMGPHGGPPDMRPPDMGPHNMGPPDMGPHGGMPDMGPHGGPPDMGPHGGPPEMGPHGGPPDMGPYRGPQGMGPMGPPDFGPHGGPHDMGPPGMGPPDPNIPFQGQPPHMYDYPPPPPPGHMRRFRRFVESMYDWSTGNKVHRRHRRAVEGGHGVEHSLLEELTHIFHLMSMAVLSFLVFVTILKIFSMGRKFIHNKLEVFDAFVVATSWALDIAFLDGIWAHPGPNAATILLFLLPWRVVRIVNSFVMVIEERGHVKLKLTKQKLRTSDKKITGLKLSIERYRMETRSLQGLCRKYHAPEPEINACAPMWKRRRSSLVSMMEGCAKMALVPALGVPNLQQSDPNSDEDQPQSRRIRATDSGVSSVSLRSSYDDFRVRRDSSFTPVNDMHSRHNSMRRRDSDSSMDSSR